MEFILFFSPIYSVWMFCGTFIDCWGSGSSCIGNVSAGDYVLILMLSRAAVNIYDLSWKIRLTKSNLVVLKIYMICYFDIKMTSVWEEQEIRVKSLGVITGETLLTGVLSFFLSYKFNLYIFSYYLSYIYHLNNSSKPINAGFSKIATSLCW